MGGEGDIVVTTSDMERGVPKDLPMSSFDLTIADYKGKEIDPIIGQVSQKFIDDESLVRSRAFAQFLWRRNIGNFEERCKKIKVEQPNKLDSDI